MRNLLLSLLLPLASLQAAFYVAPHGDDANPGTEVKPFATLTRARDAVRALRRKEPQDKPVMVLLKGGIYELDEPLALEPEDSGTAKSPTVFMAAPGERPIISGGRVIKGWRKEGNAYVADLPEAKAGEWYPHQLFMRRPEQAWFERRYRPSRGLLVIGGLTDAPHRNPNGPINHRNPQDEFIYRGDDIKAFANLDDVELVAMHDWSSGRLHIREIDAENKVVKFKSFPHYRIGHWYEGGRNPYLLENLKEEFGKPGQWYLDRPTGRLSYTPLPGEDLTKCTVVAPRIERLVTITGDAEGEHFVEHVQFRGITFGHSAWLRAPHKYALDFKRQCRQGFVDMPSAVELKWAANCRIEDCTLANMGSYGIDFADGCQDNAAIGNVMYDMGTGGVKVGTVHRAAAQPQLPTGNFIENNVISNTGLVHYSGHGIWGGMCAKTRIRHNVVTRTLYSSVAVGWSHGKQATGCRDNLIEYNHVHDVLLLLDHGGALYTLGNQPGTVLRGNLIHDTYQTYLHGEYARPIWAGGGLAFDDGSSGFLVEANIMYNIASPAAHALTQGRSGDMDMIRGNFCEIKPGDPTYPTALAAKAGLEPKYRRLLKRSFKIAAPPILAMRVPKGLKPAPLRDTFDRIKVGGRSRLARCRLEEKAPGKGRDAIVVTDEAAADGDRSLKIQDAEGLSKEWIPYVAYSPNYRGGRATVEFALRTESKTQLECVWRGSVAGREFSVGPQFKIAGGKLLAGQEELLAVPPDQWLRFRMTAKLGLPDPGIGKAGNADHGVWQLTVTMPDGTTAIDKTFPFAQKDFSNLGQVMFVSLAQEKTACYLDSVRIRNE